MEHSHGLLARVINLLSSCFLPDDTSDLPELELLRRSDSEIPEPTTIVTMPIPNGYGYTNGAGADPGPSVIAPPPLPANMARVCVWKLRPAVEPIERKVPANTEVLYNGRPNLETVLGTDDRVLVRDEDIMPGGKYRPIVKLFLNFEGQGPKEEFIATGWLVANDIVATAGHCAYDHSHDFKQAVRIKAFMGYKGKESVDSKDTNFAKLDVQLRSGKAIATTHNWLYDGTNEAADVAFILLDQPFKDVTPFTWHKTPAQGECTLGVVGYPGDRQDPETDEHGAFMYEDLKEKEYNFAAGVNKEKHLLEYKIDTYGGNSGSPVLARFADSDRLIPVGVHVYGEQTKNSASLIGPGGNDFPTYINALRAFDTNSDKYPIYSDDPDQPWLTFVDLPTPTDEIPLPPGPVPDGPTPGPSPGPDDHGGGEAYDPKHLGGKVAGVDEGFLDVLNKALSIFNPESTPVATTELLDDKQPRLILNRKLAPLIVPPVAALSTVALHAAGKIAATSAARIEAGSESTPLPNYTYEGAAERAVWGEAAIQALHHLGNQKCLELGVFETMAGIVKEISPVVRAAAPAILPAAVSEAAYRIALDNLAKTTSGSPESYDASKHVRELGDLKREVNARCVGFIPPTEMAEFVKGCQDACKQEHAQEFLGLPLGTIGKVIGKGLTLVGPLLGTIAKTGLGLLLAGGESMESGGGGEAGTAAPRPMGSFEGFAERALIGEAGLRAVIKLGAERAQQEGLFQVMVDHVAKWAPTVAKTVPLVIRVVTPVIKEILDQKRAAARSAGGTTELLWQGAHIPEDPNEAIVWPMMEAHEELLLRNVPAFLIGIADLDTPPAPPNQNDVDDAQVIGPGFQAVEDLLERGQAGPDHPANPQVASQLGRDTVLAARDTYLGRIRDEVVNENENWENHVRRGEIFHTGHHLMLNGQPPNYMQMFQFVVQGVAPNPVGQFQAVINQRAGLWRLVVRLLDHQPGQLDYGHIEFVPNANSALARVELHVNIAEISAGRNNRPDEIPDAHLVASMTVEAYCRMLRIMMRNFTWNTTGHNLGYWLPPQ